MFIEGFPGLGVKDYKDATPEVQQLQDSIKGHQELLKLKPDWKPQLIFTNSYGIYAGLVVAGVIGTGLAIILARKRAELVEKAELEREQRGESRTGMISVLGITTDKVQSLANELDIHISNYNGPLAQVLSDSWDKLAKFEQVAADRLGRVRLSRLPIIGAHHSILRQPDSIEYATVLEGYRDQFKPPQVDILTTTNSKPLISVDMIIAELATQMVKPVYLDRIMREMTEGKSGVLVDVGPSSSLKKLGLRIVKRNFDFLALEEDSEHIKML